MSLISLATGLRLPTAVGSQVLQSHSKAGDDFLVVENRHLLCEPNSRIPVTLPAGDDQEELLKSMCADLPDCSALTSLDGEFLFCDSLGRIEQRKTNTFIKISSILPADKLSLATINSAFSRPGCEIDAETTVPSINEAFKWIESNMKAKSVDQKGKIDAVNKSIQAAIEASYIKPDEALNTLKERDQILSKIADALRDAADTEPDTSNTPGLQKSVSPDPSEETLEDSDVDIVNKLAVIDQDAALKLEMDRMNGEISTLENSLNLLKWELSIEATKDKEISWHIAASSCDKVVPSKDGSIILHQTIQPVSDG